MTDNGISYSAHGWDATPPADRLPALKGQLTCDVAVIGGGYTGMATALRLAERGADVVLLESGFCGCGASSRNAGQLSSAPAGDPQLLSTLHPRRFRDIVRFGEGAARFTEGMIERLGIDCEYEATGNVGAAISAGQLRKAERNARILRKAGADVEFGGGRELGLPEGFRGGYLERAGGHLDPGKFALGLRGALLASSTRVFEETPAGGVYPDSNGVTVTVPRGRLRAERVVLATNAYSRDLLISPKRMVSPVWAHEVETAPIGHERLEAIGWTSRAGIITQHNLLENYRPTARGTIVFGVRQLKLGRGTVRDREPDRAVVADLVRGFHDRFPSLRDIAPRRAWGGWVAMTPPWLPVAGEAARNVFYAAGYNGHGLAQAPYLGTLLADRLAGDAPHEDLGALWRARPRFAPTPVSSPLTLRAGWAVDRLADRLSKRLPPRGNGRSHRQ
ncbi:FAD-binding oxidoreductase [Streptomyces sp. NPDC050617]|uniref:NAD(P)/FAD-dependent oxidoreductase n=1 Tax=Streptomyces sp. NPDC050617 TaxID=3154628 RepID=UPI0034210EB8